MNKPKQFYIKNSSIYNGLPFYNKDKVAQALKAAGLENVHIADPYGWSTQPKVVVFTGDPSRAIEALKGIHPIYPIVVEKSWK